VASAGAEYDLTASRDQFVARDRTKLLVERQRLDRGHSVKPFSGDDIGSRCDTDSIPDLSLASGLRLGGCILRADANRLDNRFARAGELCFWMSQPRSDVYSTLPRCMRHRSSVLRSDTDSMDDRLTSPGKLRLGVFRL
jgi:hypothetical protein